MTFEQDKHNYAKAINEFPNQVTQGIELAKAAKVEKDFESALICGMGASSMATEIIAEVMNSTKPIIGVRKYYLPAQADQKTLVIASSYSGNTEETLACLGNALEEKMSVIGLSTNGKLQEICEKEEIPLVTYPKMEEGFQPRWAFGYSFAAIMTVLGNCQIIPDMTAELKKAARQIDIEDLRIEGQKIAKQIGDKEPAIYGPQTLSHLARVWQISFNEDAKIPASWNSFPEANHYETTGYTQTDGNRVAIMINDPADNPRIKERMEITAKLLQGKNVETIFTNLPEGGNIYRLLSGIVLGMWVSYHLAKAKEIDPAPTVMVEKLKTMLS